MSFLATNAWTKLKSAYQMLQYHQVIEPIGLLEYHQCILLEITAIVAAR